MHAPWVYFVISIRTIGLGTLCVFAILECAKQEKQCCWIALNHLKMLDTFPANFIFIFIWRVLDYRCWVPSWSWNSQSPSSKIYLWDTYSNMNWHTQETRMLARLCTLNCSRDVHLDRSCTGIDTMCRLLSFEGRQDIFRVPLSDVLHVFELHPKVFNGCNTWKSPCHLKSQTHDAWNDCFTYSSQSRLAPLGTYTL